MKFYCVVSFVVVFFGIMVWVVVGLFVHVLLVGCLVVDFLFWLFGEFVLGW